MQNEKKKNPMKFQFVKVRVSIQVFMFPAIKIAMPQVDEIIHKSDVSPDDPSRI
jgi:hypothetical protein